MLQSLCQLLVIAIILPLQAVNAFLLTFKVAYSFSRLSQNTRMRAVDFFSPLLIIPKGQLRARMNVRNIYGNPQLFQRIQAFEY